MPFKHVENKGRQAVATVFSLILVTLTAYHGA